MKYKLLILDHDDTCVDSTAKIHYPAHLEVMKRVRPEITPVDLNGWFSKNFDPGIMAYLLTELKFNNEELDLEMRIWRMYTESRTAEFFPGIPELLRDFKSAGGKLTVVSHSEVPNIRSLYQQKAPEIMPDLIFGWDDDPRKRKPNPWPAQEILRIMEVKPEEVLMVDDLRPGIDMANGLGIHTAGAGWSHEIPAIREYMKKNTRAYLRRVEDFRKLLEL